METFSGILSLTLFAFQTNAYSVNVRNLRMSPAYESPTIFLQEDEKCLKKIL